MQTAAQATAAVARNDAPAHDIVDTAVAAGNLSILVNAVKAADLVSTLKGEGPFTVFAPTDEAFRKLAPGTVDGLLKDRAKLTSILTYHVVAGKVMAKDIKAGDVEVRPGRNAGDRASRQQRHDQ